MDCRATLAMTNLWMSNCVSQRCIISVGRGGTGGAHTAAHGALERGRVRAGNIVTSSEQAGCDALRRSQQSRYAGKSGAFFHDGLQRLQLQAKLLLGLFKHVSR